MFKVFIRCLTSRTSGHDQTKINILQIFHAVFESIPKRLEEEYHLIKDDTLFVSMYTTGKVIVKGLLIPADLITDEIQDTQEYKDYVKEFVKVDVLMIQPQLVESTQGTYRVPRAPRTPNPVVDIVQKKKGKCAARETRSPIPSLKIHVRQQKPISPTIPPPSDDRERDDITEATLLSLALHKTTKITEKQENVAAVEKKILEEDVDKIVEGKDEESYASEFADLIFLDEEDFGTRLEPESHKENPEEVDDDDNKEEKKDDKKDDDNDDADNDDHNDHALVRTQVTGISKEFTAIVSPTPATTSQDRSKSKHSSSKTKILPESITPMSRQRGQLRKHMKNTFVTNNYIQEKMKEMPDTLNNLVPELTVAKTNELIKEAVPRMVNDAVKKDREISTSNVPELMKSNLQAQVGDPDMWDILKKKFEKSSASASSCRVHDAHQGDDGPPEGIVEVVRVTTKQQQGLDYMQQIIVMKENDKPDSVSEADFKYLNKNDIEDISTGLIYLNNKEEKRVMNLVEIVKFCDDTLERVLKEVKLKIFETEFLKKARSSAG
ncbi:hypothetical protein Tco_1074517 [Tanacetum coccineum]